MKIRNKRPAIYLSAALALTAAACVLRTIALLTDYSYITGFFREKTLITISTIILCVTIAGAFTYIFVGKSERDLLPDFHGPATYIPSGLLALTLLFSAGEFAIEALSSDKASAASRLLPFMAVISAILSVAYLFLNAFLNRRYSETRGAFGIAPIIFLLISAAQLYFDKTMPKNDPNKTVDLLAYIFAMIFFTAETRLSLGREKWRLYISLGIMGLATTAYSSVPTLLVYFIEAVSGGSAVMISSSIIAGMLIFSLFIFITARILVTVFLKVNETGKLASQISEEAEYLDSTEGNDLTVPDENQISIDDILIGDESEGGYEQ